MKHLYIYIFIAIATLGCSKEDRFVEFNQSHKNQKNNRTIRTAQEVERIVNTIHPTSKSTGIKISPLIARDILSSLIAINPNDTLLYLVDRGDKSMVISANVKCKPIIAIFDGPNNSILNELANPSESNSGLMDFIDQAIIYNLKPEYFDVYYNTKSPLSITDEVKPKVPVEWTQDYPFNKYVPNGYPAGCLTIAVAQALMVTRHINSFYNIPLDYDRLIKVETRSHEKVFPSETNTIARLIYEIAKYIGTKFRKEGSSANINDAIILFTNEGNRMLVDKKPSSIRKTLKYFRNGIVIVVSNNKKRVLGLFFRGEAHVYIVDGYRTYSDGSDLIHVNFGWGTGKYNGYFLTKLTTPKFTIDSPEKFPYSCNYHCIYK